MSFKKDKDKKTNEPNNEESENQNNAVPQDGGASDGEEAPTRMVLLPADDVDKLKADAAAATENLENWKRERADFLNYKKIVERDEKNLRSNVKIDMIKKYLPILDDLELAMKALPEDSREKAWFSGIDLIHKKLQKILESEGVTIIEAEEFDPTRHEAVTFEKSEGHSSGEIIEVLKKGYLLGDRVLRPAQVRVAQ
ncbi:MAG: nucleotide exchange factor GrpE [Anaerolineaceae bacterium]